MLTAIIVDDEQDSIDVLTALLANFTSFDIKQTGAANNLEDGITLINSVRPDIVFLDIDLPGKNGLAIYDNFKDPDFKIIFTTAYQQYAIEALKKSAFDYLLKPINIIELKDTLAKVIRQIEKEQRQMELEDKVNFLSAVEMTGVNILLDVESGFIMENTRNIEYCKADQSYSKVFTLAKKEIVVTKSLKQFQEILPANQFYRTHKSYLVNIYYIRKFIRTNESIVLMKSGMKIPVSVRTSAHITNDIKHMLTP